eukprot:m.72985 g.72985  ORF g.72985 m.72985 type:complete len:79 (+) comp24504_c1_seq1:693-929(+)
MDKKAKWKRLDKAEQQRSDANTDAASNNDAASNKPSPVVVIGVVSGVVVCTCLVALAFTDYTISSRKLAVPLQPDFLI